MSYQKTKKYFFDILDKGEQNGLAERIFDIFILALISLNCLAVLVESSIQSANFKNFLSIFEIVSILIFSIEYLIRLWVADLYCPEKPKWRARIRYVFSGMAIVDLLAILPFYIPFLISVDLRVLRMLRQLPSLNVERAYLSCQVKYRGRRKASSFFIISKYFNYMNRYHRILKEEIAYMRLHHEDGKLRVIKKRKSISLILSTRANKV